MDVPNELLLLQDQIFYHFWIICWKPIGGKITIFPLSQIKVCE